MQGGTFDRVARELRGTRTINIDGEMVPSRCDPYSLYVQPSRGSSLKGIILLSKASERDFVGNVTEHGFGERYQEVNRRVDAVLSGTLN